MEGKRVAIVLATDGSPTDPRWISDAHRKQMIVSRLQRLVEVPVWLVIRFCTDDGQVVKFYNS